MRITCRVPAAALGGDVVGLVAAASRFAEADPYRAATHNKGILNGIDAVLVATAQDWRAVEAGAHAYASLHGRYAPLATWRIADDGALLGELSMPLAVGTVGGALNVHRGARLALRLAGVETSVRKPPPTPPGSPAPAAAATTDGSSTAIGTSRSTPSIVKLVAIANGSA